MDVTLKLLLDSGDIRPGAGVLHVSTRDQTRHADLLADGIISFEVFILTVTWQYLHWECGCLGEMHRSLSSFAVAAIRSCGAVGRKTANGWQVVSYKGRPLEQYRADFLEKQSQASDSSHEIETVVRRASRKKRRMSPQMDDAIRRVDTASEMEDRVHVDASVQLMDGPLKKLLWMKSFARKRVRPTRTWLDIKETTWRSPSVIKSEGCNASGGLHLTKAVPIKRQTPEEEEEDTRERLELNMWMKKALNKRHREECGMI